MCIESMGIIVYEVIFDVLGVWFVLFYGFFVVELWGGGYLFYRIYKEVEIYVDLRFVIFWFFFSFVYL